MLSGDQRARDAAALFGVLLGLDGGSLETIAEATGQDEATLKPLLGALADEGLLRLVDGQPARFLLVDADSGLAAIAARRRADLDRMRAGLELDLGVLGVPLARSPAPVTWRPDIERIDDLPAVRTRLGELHRAASVELLSFDYGQPVRARRPEREAAYEDAARLDRDWLARGGSMRTILPDAVRHDALAWAAMHRPISEGGLVRLSTTLPMQLLVIDRETAVVQVDPGDSAAGALFVREPGIVSALVDLFEVYWMHATELDAPPDHEVGRLSAQQLAVLRLLELGHKDESIARHLGVSLRTASRAVSDTLDLLGAESRFQAGVLAARRGWL